MGSSSVYRGKKIATPEGSIQATAIFGMAIFLWYFLNQRPTIIFATTCFFFLVYCYFLVSILWPSKYASKYEDIPLFSKNNSPPVSDLIPLILVVKTTLPEFYKINESK